MDVFPGSGDVSQYPYTTPLLLLLHMCMATIWDRPGFFSLYPIITRYTNTCLSPPLSLVHSPAQPGSDGDTSRSSGVSGQFRPDREPSLTWSHTSPWALTGLFLVGFSAAICDFGPEWVEGGSCSEWGRPDAVNNIGLRLTSFLLWSAKIHNIPFNIFLSAKLPLDWLVCL